MSKSWPCIALVAGTFLGGCGGGGDSISGASVPGSMGGNVSAVLRAEGVYTGSMSNGDKHETIVTENGQLYMVHGDLGSSNQSLIEGPGKPDNGSYSSTDIKDYRPFGTFIAGQYVPFALIPASISASYTTAGTFTGTISEPNEVISFTGSRPILSAYDYDQPASLDKIAGSWGGFLLGLSVTSSGDIHVSSRECEGKGTIKPRTGGKNVFDIEWTFVSIPACPFYEQTIKSIGFVRSIADGSSSLSQKLVIIATDPNRTNARSYSFTR